MCSSDLPDGTLDFNIPLFVSNMSSKWESILSSLFTNNIINQRVFGGSAVMLSSAFLTDNSPSKVVIQEEDTTEGNLEKLIASEISGNTDKIGINWLDRKLGDRRLRTIEYTKDGNKILKAECLLPAWSKKFFVQDGNGNLVLDDINNIPEELRTLLW